MASLDGVALPLSQRGPVTTPGDAPKTYFPVLMCEASVPAFGHTAASINGVTLKMPVTNPKRILVIGDTGCRVAATLAATQNCNDPTQFPLQYVANYAATFKPDLIVHVGDFFYREQPCPAGFAGCANNAVFDNWDSWNADWFSPAANLIAAAPMAISRGNHESCNRGAHGWFRLLDVHANTSAPDTTTMSTDGRTLPQIYTAQLRAALAPLADSNVFYITHKAGYDIRPAKLNGNLQGGDATQQSVFDTLTPGTVPAQIKLLVSGHDHQFQVVNFPSNYAPQLVVGNSGTLLDNQTGTQPQAFVPDTTGTNAGASYALPGVTGTPTIMIQATNDRSEYGFTVMDATSAGYLVNTYNLSSSKVARCAITLSPRSMQCAQ